MSKDEMTTSDGGEFMLFGVRVVVDSMRKSVSLNNLSQYQHRLDVGKEVVPDVVAGYVSADDVVRQTSSATTTTVVNRERKRGVPWTEEEHKLFLLGLEKVGKGDWRGISRNFVKTRTPTQVASHAQKHFIRRSNVNRRRRRRSSLFDITTSSVVANLMNEDQMSKENISGVESQQQEEAAASIQAYREMSYVDLTVSSAPQAVAAATSRSNKAMMEFDLNSNADMDTNTSVFLFDPSPLSLNLSLSLSSGVAKASSSKSSTFQVMQRCGYSDGMISVA